MKHFFKTLFAGIATVLCLSTSVLAAPNVTDIQNEVSLQLDNVNNAIVTQVVTNINLVNNIDIEIDTSTIDKTKASTNNVRDVMEYSRSIRASLGIK